MHIIFKVSHMPKNNKWTYLICLLFPFSNKIPYNSSSLEQWSAIKIIIDLNKLLRNAYGLQ